MNEFAKADKAVLELFENDAHNDNIDPFAPSKEVVIKELEQKNKILTSRAKDAERELHLKNEEHKKLSSEYKSYQTKIQGYKKKAIIIVSIVFVLTIIITAVIAYNSGNKNGYDSGYSKGFKDNQPIATDGSPTVYVSPSGSKYHYKNCQYITSNNEIAISGRQAIDKGYTPCSKCGVKHLHISK